MSDPKLVPLPTQERELEMQTVVGQLHSLWRLHHEKPFGIFLATVICGPEFNITSLLASGDEEVQKQARSLKEAEQRRFDIPPDQRI